MDPDYEEDLSDEIEDVGISIMPNLPAWMTIESKRAFDIYWGINAIRGRKPCSDCQPLLLPETNDSDLCSCSFMKFFTQEQWLCLPCFFDMVSKVYAERIRRVVRFDPSQEGNHFGVRLGYVWVSLWTDILAGRC